MKFLFKVYYAMPYLIFYAARDAQATKFYGESEINLEHRIVYKVEESQIVVHSIYGHYQD